MIKIHVTQKDIENGSRCDSEECPVALAIRRKLKHSVSVSGHVIRVFDCKKSWMSFTTYHSPKKVEIFVGDFDARYKVKPFTFCLRPWKY